MKRWNIKNNSKFKIQNSTLPAGRQELQFKIQNEKGEEIVDVLLQNRGVLSEGEKTQFLHPTLESVTIQSVGIDTEEVDKTLERLHQTLSSKEQIIVFGDYDVDGITGTALLWETLHALGFTVIPYIPHRVDEGYGLSIKGIDHVLEKYPLTRLIITVDNGIVAHEAVEYANDKGIDVIITDHHMPEESGIRNQELRIKNEKEKSRERSSSKALPEAYAIVHTTKLCGAGVAYLLAQEIFNFQFSIFKQPKDKSHPEQSESEGRDRLLDKGSERSLAYARDKGTMSETSSEILRFTQNDVLKNSHLELAALGTIADLVPLVGANRAIVKLGLEKLQRTKRVGLQAIFQEVGIEQSTIGTYEVGYIIAPRLNAAGRIESAMDSLRLLCTKDRNRALLLAQQLGQVNRERQSIMKETVLHALAGIRNQESGIKKILFIGHETYNPGVIGLVAGKLVEEFYRPSIVLSIGETHAKASVRSIKGVNIIELLRKHADMYVNVGGHPMAAGFTVEVNRVDELREKLELLAEELITEEHLQRSLEIDCELPLSFVTPELYWSLQQLAPFGMSNPEPVFVSRGVTVEDIRFIGREKNHVKLKVSFRHSGEELATTPESQRKSRFWTSQNDKKFGAIGFGMAGQCVDLQVGDTIDIVYTIDENVWNGNVSLQLKLKDIKSSISVS